MEAIDLKVLQDAELIRLSWLGLGAHSWLGQVRAGVSEREAEREKLRQASA